MDVSSSSTPTVGFPESKSPLEKSTEIPAEQVTKLLEGLEEQTRQSNAQKTGVGNSVNLTV